LEVLWTWVMTRKRQSAVHFGCTAMPSFLQSWDSCLFSCCPSCECVMASALLSSLTRICRVPMVMTHPSLSSVLTPAWILHFLLGTSTALSPGAAWDFCFSQQLVSATRLQRVPYLEVSLTKTVGSFLCGSVWTMTTQCSLETDLSSTPSSHGKVSHPS